MTIHLHTLNFLAFFFEPFQKIFANKFPKNYFQ